MELIDAMRSQNTCRFYLPDDVPDQVLYRAFDNARFAPQGGNRQPVRFLVVRDQRLKRELADLYMIPWSAYVEATAKKHAIRVDDEFGTEKATWVGGNAERVMRNGDHFARHLADHPVIIVVCADIDQTHPTDTQLGRLSVGGGASIYPIVQNLCLALRDQGIGTALTTLLCAYEKEVKKLLSIPDELSTVAHVVAGYPARPFPTKLSRRPVEEFVFVDDFDKPLRCS
jgi:nitroreductase